MSLLKQHRLYSKSVAFMEKSYIRVRLRAMDRKDPFIVVSIGQQTVDRRVYGEKCRDCMDRRHLQLHHWFEGWQQASPDERFGATENPQQRAPPIADSGGATIDLIVAMAARSPADRHRRTRNHRPLPRSRRQPARPVPGASVIVVANSGSEAAKYRHSYRSVTMGSTRPARRAGI